MCGICGIFVRRGRGADHERRVQTMARSLAHRGPDAEGVFVSRRAALGHRRLSIIDLTSGGQPMSTADGSHTIVYNGEIYNFPELRRDLEARGAAFRTGSDTEVILQGFALDGPAFFSRLNGIFALAVWDERRGELTLARDPLGIKPLYVADAGGAVIFASEPKAIFASELVEKRFNAEALFEFLARHHPPYLETLYEGVRELPPGHAALLASGQEPVIRPFLMLDDFLTDRPETADEQGATDALDALLAEVASRQLLSNVPVGILLSSGIDSGLLFHHMLHAYAADSIHAFTYSIETGEDDEADGAVDWTRRQRKNLVHHILRLTLDAQVDLLDAATVYLDGPVVYPSSTPVLALNRLAALSGIKVVLSGQGADELFLGYVRHLSLYENMVRHGRASQIEAAYFGGGLGSVDLVEDLTGRSRTSVREGATWKWLADHVHLPPDRFLSLFDLKFRLLELLRRDDRMGMGASVEIRVPFLDNEVVRFALNLPAGLKINHFRQKYLPKLLAGRLFGLDCLTSAKKGSPTDISVWLRDEAFLERVRALIGEPDSLASAHLRPEGVRRLLEEHGRDRSRSHLVWCLFTLERWWRLCFLDDHSAMAETGNPLDFKLARRA